LRAGCRSRTDRLGNFWVDVTRGVVRLLIPLAVIGCLVLVASGAIENLRFHMARLRGKLEDNPARPRHLLTEPGMGYRYQP
jgi:K+-transporting ATPase A subunit